MDDFSAKLLAANTFHPPKIRQAYIFQNENHLLSKGRHVKIILQGCTAPHEGAAPNKLMRW
jgi:hypothetical protein